MNKQQISKIKPEPKWIRIVMMMSELTYSQNDIKPQDHGFILMTLRRLEELLNAAIREG